MTTPPSFGLSQSNVDTLADCVKVMQGMDLLRGSTILEKAEQAIADLRKGVGEAEALHKTVSSLLMSFVHEMCSLKAEPIEPEQYPPDEKPRYESDNGVIRLGGEAGESNPAPLLGWCPECCDGGYKTPLQKIELTVGTDTTVLYCKECAFTNAHENLLVSQYRDFNTRFTL